MDQLVSRSHLLTKIRLFVKNSISQYFSSNLDVNVDQRKWNTKSISEKVSKFYHNCLDGLQVLENSKLVDLVNISTLAVELRSKHLLKIVVRNILFGNHFLLIVKLILDYF